MNGCFTSPLFNSRRRGVVERDEWMYPVHPLISQFHLPLILTTTRFLGYISRSSDDMSSLVILLIIPPRVTYTPFNEYFNMSTTPSHAASSE